ncbi:MAG: hypothetical protein JW917_00835 [Ignavibacteria bacterium]|nr:hypothetical protein [Ignavibacteria bacterium]
MAKKQEPLSAENEMIVESADWHDVDTFNYEKYIENDLEEYKEFDNRFYIALKRCLKYHNEHPTAKRKAYKFIINECDQTTNKITGRLLCEENKILSIEECKKLFPEIDCFKFSIIFYSPYAKKKNNIAGKYISQISDKFRVRVIPSTQQAATQNNFNQLQNNFNSMNQFNDLINYSNMALNFASETLKQRDQIKNEGVILGRYQRENEILRQQISEMETTKNTNTNIERTGTLVEEVLSTALKVFKTFQSPGDPAAPHKTYSTVNIDPE